MSLALACDDDAETIESKIELSASVSPRHVNALSASAPISPRGPSLLSMYSAVVAILGFAFAASFPPKVIRAEEVQAHLTPSRTHLAVLLALQQLAGHVLASRRGQNLSISAGHARSLLSCLRESFVFARKANDAIPLRRYLQGMGWRYGMTMPSSNELPSLLPQEVVGKQEYLHVLFTTLTCSVNNKDIVPIDEQEGARRYMERLVQDTLDEYLTWTGVASRHLENGKVVPADVEQRVEYFTSLVVATLRELAELDSTELQRHMSWLYPLLTKLVMVPNAEVREALSNVLSKAVRQLLPPM